MRGVGMESAVSAVIAILRKKKKGTQSLNEKHKIVLPFIHHLLWYYDQ